mgnify:CR=1 FL=1
MGSKEARLFVNTSKSFDDGLKTSMNATMSCKLDFMIGNSKKTAGKVIKGPKYPVLPRRAKILGSIPPIWGAPSMVGGGGGVVLKYQLATSFGFSQPISGMIYGLNTEGELNTLISPDDFISLLPESISSYNFLENPRKKNREKKDDFAALPAPRVRI